MAAAEGEEEEEVVVVEEEEVEEERAVGPERKIQSQIKQKTHFRSFYTSFA